MLHTIAAPDDSTLIRQAGPTTFQDALAAAKAGRHVLALGPPATDLADFDQLSQVCQRNRVALIVGGVSRFARRHRLARKTVSEGRIGEPVFVRYSDPGADATNDWAVASVIDLAGWIFGLTPVAIYAQGIGNRPGEQPSHLTISVSYPNGATALISLGSPAGSPSYPTTSVLGRRGALYDNQTGTSQIILAGEQAIALTPEGNDPVEAWLDGVSDSIRSGIITRDWPDGRLSLEILELLNASLASGSVERRRP